MRSIVQNPDAGMPSQNKTRSSWRLGMIAWILILGLFLVNAGFLFGGFDWDKRTVDWLIYRIDPRYWPLWPVPILWGIVAWMLNSTLKSHIERIAKEQTGIKWIIILVTLCWTAWLADWTFVWANKRVYYKYYVTYMMGPIALYLTNGTTSWELLILPTMLIGPISALSYVIYRQHRKNHESKTDFENFDKAAG